MRRKRYFEKVEEFCGVFRYKVFIILNFIVLKQLRYFEEEQEVFKGRGGTFMSFCVKGFITLLTQGSG